MNYNLSLKDSVIDNLLLWLNDNYEKIITTDGLVQQTGTSATAVMSQKAVTDALATKQDILTFDPSPVSGSQNPVTSGGIFSAIESAKGAAGLAEALLDTDSEGAEQEFALRPSGGDGGAYFRRLLGNTKAFNQFLNVGSTPITGTIDNSAGTSAIAANIIVGTDYAVNGHRYLVRANFIGDNPNVVVYGEYIATGVTDVKDAPAILTCESNQASTMRIVVRVPAGQTLTYSARPMISDLTAMQDNSTTPEEFREKYPLLYYAYGRKLIHNKVAKVITKGANQWDEVWEVGDINASGANAPANDRIRSKNYCPALPDTTYYTNIPNKASGSYMGFINWYDANKNFISREPCGPASALLVTSPAQAAYFKFVVRANYGTTYANDICINISDAEINGQYFPYWERELALDITNQEDTDGNKPFAEGAKSCPVASDEFNEVGGIVRVGVRPYQVSDDTDASVITDGVDTAYALNDPVPFTWKEPLNTGIKVSKYGTEETTPAQTENIDNAPFRAVTTYSISVANLLAALTALGNRGGAKGSLGGGNPGNGEELTPEEESPKEEENPKEEETPVVEPEVQSKR